MLQSLIHTEPQDRQAGVSLLQQAISQGIFAGPMLSVYIFFFLASEKLPSDIRSMLYKVVTIDGNLLIQLDTLSACE